VKTLLIDYMRVIDDFREYMHVLLSQKSWRKERKVIRAMMVQAMLKMKTSLVETVVGCS
jgi:chaperonin GroEL (HSP60 family)